MRYLLLKQNNLIICVLVFRKPSGFARYAILQSLLVLSEETFNIRETILDLVRRLDDSGNDKSVESFLSIYDDYEIFDYTESAIEDDEDDEDQWNRDDWNNFKVPDGDVLMSDDPENEDMLPIDRHFAASIIAISKQVHPELHLSRNCQVTLNDIAEAVTYEVISAHMEKTLILTVDLVKSSMVEFLKAIKYH